MFIILEMNTSLILRHPFEHVALFDEAQRAWNLEQASSWMRRKKNNPNYNISEPES